MISLLTWVLAAICNSIMDTIADKSHFDKSIMSRFDSEFWLKTDSWDNKYVDTDGDGEGEVSAGFRFKGPIAFMNNFLDGWHIFQACMIVFLAISVITFPYMPSICLFDNLYLNMLIWLGIYGIGWNLPFNLFYNKLLKSEFWNK